MKLFKLIFINLTILAVLLVLIDPFLAVEKEPSKTYRSLHMREYSPKISFTQLKDLNEVVADDMEK